MTRVPDGTKCAVNLSVSADLLAEGRAANVNFSALLEQALIAELTRLEAVRWRADNALAVVAYNVHVERSGTFRRRPGSR